MNIGRAQVVVAAVRAVGVRMIVPVVMIVPGPVPVMVVTAREQKGALLQTLMRLTTKRVAWKTAAREMLWFLTGDTNIRELVRQKVHIWTDWPLDRYRRETGEEIDRDTFEARVLADDAFAAQWGDLGPVYGKQWVNWDTYEPAGEGLFRRGAPVNQIAELVEAIRRNHASRRLLFTGWNVAELGGMALPPCHMTYQYHVAGGRLSGMLWQRSCDLGLGFPFFCKVTLLGFLTSKMHKMSEMCFNLTQALGFRPLVTA